jgi:hypothetical protein
MAKYYLYLIKGIPGQEFWTDRNLLFPINDLTQDTNSINCIPNLEGILLDSLKLNQTLGLLDDTQKILTYFKLNSFKFDSPNLVLKITPIQT